MKKSETMDTFNRNTEEIKTLSARIETLRRQNKILLDKYAEEKAKEAGWTTGKKLIIEKQSWDRKRQCFNDPKPEPYFYHHAWADVHNGNVYLEFTRAKKDGTPSKIVCHSEYLIVED